MEEKGADMRIGLEVLQTSKGLPLRWTSSLRRSLLARRPSRRP